jgi:DNA-binding transcriptional regulator YiaG
VNPQHLRWATPTENAADKITHGRNLSREAHPNAKLTEEAVAIIRRKERGVTHADLAKRFGVSKSTIAMVSSGRNWRG